ncbi:hypothetical protein BegalDRAFT_3496 [Beggiatoa alba B18LD]|uniref:ATP-binding protein n=1 Tax=Beggiatoa alba B18LD TaxID=395493 RepID=I3CL13_9GAMM|nr:DUF6272 family protein [Beggiatoa alba]EIJ44306.1 hypothetical protein BegalDRAFT_3496 [Beggiatoa alba B18LD]
MQHQTASTYKIFGEFVEKLPEYIESLTINFYPTYAPLKKRWENNGLSADFIANYFRVFYISKQEDIIENIDNYLVDNLRNSVKYVANELLENAMKFQDESIPFRKSTASIVLSLHSDKIIFSVSNCATLMQATKLERYIEKLLTNDTAELYLQTMRNSLNNYQTDYSGLGLLSMICDHAAKLGWKFQPNELDMNIINITTMVTLNAEQPL